MDKLTIDEYLNLTDNEKWDYLRRVYNDNLRLIGIVDKLEDSYCILRYVRIISNNICEYFIPFADDNHIIDEIFGSRHISEELMKNGIEKGDAVFFEIRPNWSQFEEKERYFTIRKGSIMKAEEVADFYYHLGLEKSQSNLITKYSADGEENIIYFGQDLKKAFEYLLTLIEDKKEEKEKIEKEIEELSEKYQRKLLKCEDEYYIKEKLLKAEYDKKKKELEKEIKEREKNIEFLKKYDLLGYEEYEASNKDEDKVDIEDIDERIEYIQGYMFSNERKPLGYDKSIIKSFYAGLQTDQIIILAGKPGSGKTSFIEGFAEAVDAELTLIPVQSNWMDKSDLLGFYNPIEKSYISTPFLDAFIKATNQASEDEDKIFFICLDEMNLSHVEHYFADFLSKLQTDRIIQLYSKSIYEEIKEEIRDRSYKFKVDVDDLEKEDFLKQASSENIENYLQLKRLCKLIHKYPYEIKIPPNVKFLGTINKDETTKDLSPKVVDRSFIIMLENSKDGIQNQNLLEAIAPNKDYTKKLNLKYSDLNVEARIIEKELEDRVKALKGNFIEFNIPLSYRFDKTTNQLYAAGCFNNVDELLDVAISSLILPKINLYIEDSTFTDIIDLLEEVSQGKPITSSVIRWMLKYDDGILTFWR